MLHLEFPDLRLTVEVVKRNISARGEPYQDFLECRGVAAVRGFEVPFTWSAMYSELRDLCERLSQMHRDFPSVESVLFDPAERNVRLKFGLQGGEYTFQPDLVGGPIVSGSFGFDQSYIPGVVEALDGFLSGSEAAA